MLIAFGCDPNATGLKSLLIETALELGHQVMDLGSEDPISPPKTAGMPIQVAACLSDWALD